LDEKHQAAQWGSIPQHALLLISDSYTHFIHTLQQVGSVRSQRLYKSVLCGEKESMSFMPNARDKAGNNLFNVAPGGAPQNFQCPIHKQPGMNCVGQQWHSPDQFRLRWLRPILTGKFARSLVLFQKGLFSLPVSLSVVPAVLFDGFRLQFVPAGLDHRVQHNLHQKNTLVTQ